MSDAEITDQVVVFHEIGMRKGWIISGEVLTNMDSNKFVTKI